VQINKNNYATILFISKQASLPKISLILQKIKIGPKCFISPFCTKAFNNYWWEVFQCCLPQSFPKSHLGLYFMYPFYDGSSREDVHYHYKDSVFAHNILNKILMQPSQYSVHETIPTGLLR